MSTNAYHTGLHKGISTAQPSSLLVDEVASDEQTQNSKLALDFKVGSYEDDSKKKTTEAEAIIEMFTKQSEITEKYTKHLELLEKQTKESEPVEAVTAMVEQMHTQTDAILSTVQKDEDDFPEELQQQLETVLSRTEEALGRLMRRLKRKAATGQVQAKAAAPEVLTPSGPSGDKV
ncbi:MAG: hypothetical protein Q9204_005590 [Flavoplaca sp. TL-2023a]